MIAKLIAIAINFEKNDRWSQKIDRDHNLQNDRDPDRDQKNCDRIQPCSQKRKTKVASPPNEIVKKASVIPNRRGLVWTADFNIDGK